MSERHSLLPAGYRTATATLLAYTAISKHEKTALVGGDLLTFDQERTLFPNKEILAMVAADSLLSVAIISLGMVLTPGPNMVYLTSRSISQGRVVGLISLAGVAFGFICYLFASALGLATLFKAVPMAYDIIRVAGAVYLGYMAWNILRPNGQSIFEARRLPPHSPRRLFVMGWVTNLLSNRQWHDCPGSFLCQCIPISAAISDASPASTFRVSAQPFLCRSSAAQVAVDIK